MSKEPKKPNQNQLNRWNIMLNALISQDPLRVQMEKNAENLSLDSIKENFTLWSEYVKIQRDAMQELKKLREKK